MVSPLLEEVLQLSWGQTENPSIEQHLRKIVIHADPTNTIPAYTDEWWKISNLHKEYKYKTPALLFSEAARFARQICAVRLLSMLHVYVSHDFQGNGSTLHPTSTPPSNTHLTDLVATRRQLDFTREMLAIVHGILENIEEEVESQEPKIGNYP